MELLHVKERTFSTTALAQNGITYMPEQSSPNKNLYSFWMKVKYGNEWLIKTEKLIQLTDEEVNELNANPLRVKNLIMTGADRSAIINHELTSSAVKRKTFSLKVYDAFDEEYRKLTLKYELISRSIDSYVCKFIYYTKMSNIFEAEVILTDALYRMLMSNTQEFFDYYLRFEELSIAKISDGYIIRPNHYVIDENGVSIELGEGGENYIVNFSTKENGNISIPINNIKALKPIQPTSYFDSDHRFMTIEYVNNSEETCEATVRAIGDKIHGPVYSSLRHLSAVSGNRLMYNQLLEDPNKLFIDMDEV